MVPNCNSQTPGTSTSAHPPVAPQQGTQPQPHVVSNAVQVSPKQARLHEPDILERDATPQINHLARLPFEMLAEVLSQTASPDILALSRTSRYFCTTLVTNLSSQFVWRDARKRFLPIPIPDPLPTWTESAYIAFLFDPAPCEVCHQTTGRTPFSYALRARLCDSTKCEITWISGLEVISVPSGLSAPPHPDTDHEVAVKSWLPLHEATFQHHTRLYRPEEWKAAFDELKASVQYPTRYRMVQQEFARKASRLPEIMKYALTLKEWGDMIEPWRLSVDKHNIQFLKDKAKAEGWEIQDFLNTPLYTSLRKHQIKTSEKLTHADFALVKDQFLAEVAECRKIRIRRAVENTARINRDDIRNYWTHLKTIATTAFPSYPEFRRLGMPRILALKNTTEELALDENKESVRCELKDNATTREHIQQEVDIWLADKRTKLAEALGDKYSALAVPAGLIHPVERTTAWFACTRCKRVGRNLEEDKALTFAGVCAHLCLGLPKKNKLKGAWDVAWFEPDFQAIQAAKEVSRVCGLNEETSTTAEFNDFGCRFLCKSCPVPIVMDASSVIGHSKRHKRITLELLEQDQANTILHTPLQRGLTSKLLGFTKSGKRERNQCTYACRHCQTEKAFTFDGLRSHCKVKHSIVEMRDEDFLRVEQASTPQDAPMTN